MSLSFKHWKTTDAIWFIETPGFSLEFLTFTKTTQCPERLFLRASWEKKTKHFPPPPRRFSRRPCGVPGSSPFDRWSSAFPPHCTPERRRAKWFPCKRSNLGLLFTPFYILQTGHEETFFKTTASKHTTWKKPFSLLDALAPPILIQQNVHAPLIHLKTAIFLKCLLETSAGGC